MLPLTLQPRHRSVLFACALACLQLHCMTPRVAVPGHTAYTIGKVKIVGNPVGLGELLDKLALRRKSLIKPGQNYNPYRAAEDKRRVRAYFKTRGYLDAVVTGPRLDTHEKTRRIDVTWTVKPGLRYRIAEVRIIGAPAEAKAALTKLVPFGAGDAVDDVQAWRLFRVTLSEYLRDRGWAHAETYSRLYIQHAKQRIYWVYFIDPGPRTVVGKITIEGTRRIPKTTVLRRLGLKPGDPYNHRLRLKSQLDLLDMGSFNVVRVHDNADNEFMIGKLPPDTGGVLRPGQVGPDGRLVPRKLSPRIDLRVVVTEAPKVKGRFVLGGSVDTERLDSYLGGGVVFRDLFGAAHHLSLQGRVGYGWLFRGESEEPLGLYGRAGLRYDHPGFLHRLVDLRIFGEFRERWFPSFHTREVRSGLGLRTAIGSRIFLDFDLGYRWGVPIGLGEVAASTRDALALSVETLSGLELSTALVWDERDNRVEALRGHMLSVHAAYGPGGPVGSHRYLKLGADLRAFIPIPKYFAVGLRFAGDWILAAGAEGVPPSMRLFGGGAFGMRGFGLKRMTAYADACLASGTCRSVGVGAMSMVTATADFRWLPYRKQVGANLFVDIGAASASANPFEEGVSVALGLGTRVRLWYLPMSIDIAYRVAQPASYSSLGRFTAFFRIGEAF